MTSHPNYPVRVEASLDPHLSRWLWLVKWLLAIPHFFLLAILFIGFGFATFFAWFAILFTGRYPRGLFEFNVGVLRWSWRVGYYTYYGLGTDLYPPFTLEDVPDYPAHFDIEYPERLSRGLIFVKWLLAIPHLLIVGLVVGGSSVAWRSENWNYAFPGVLGVLVFVAAIMLLFTGRYPPALFDFIVGLNRWCLRVGAYVGLMRDEYPPFRLDVGGSETGPPLSASAPSPLAPSDPSDPMSPGPPPPGAAAVTAEPGEPTYHRAWSAGTAIAVIAGAIISLIGFGLMAGGGIALWFDNNGRDSQGFISTPTVDLSTPSSAIVTGNIKLRNADGPQWAYPSSLFGDARVKASSSDGSQIFIGVARTSEVRTYLNGTSYARGDDFADNDLIERRGDRPAPPTDESFWMGSVLGKGEQTLVWSVEDGDWSIVVMHPDAKPGLDLRVSVGATLPGLSWIAIALLLAGGIILIIGVALVIGGVYRHSHRT